MELESSPKNKTATDEQWRGLISIYANIWTSINKGTVTFQQCTEKKEKKKKSSEVFYCTS